MELSAEDRQRAFAWWLRKGHWPTVRREDGVELKFNPYHDPRNGRFTFAPGGSAGSGSGGVPGDGPSGGRREGMAVPSVAQRGRPPGRPPQTPGRGSNSRAFEDPMTLEQAFPGLRGAPGGAIIAAADGVFDLTGPATEAQAQVMENWSRALVAQIRAIDPAWREEQLAPVTSIAGRTNRLNDLRWQRAAVVLRVQGDVRPLQVETARFIRQSADDAYDIGLTLLKSGRLTQRLSERETLGNFVDREVRRDLRRQYGWLGIDSAGKGPVRVNRRENDTSGNELTYRRPDARVGAVAFDVTLTRKTLSTPQIRGFFNTDFKPRSVVIIRPSQLGTDTTYVISRPETTQ